MTTPLPYTTPGKSMNARFDKMNLRSATQRGLGDSTNRKAVDDGHLRLGLTPVMEELSHLNLTSTVKKARDDFHVTPSQVPVLMLEIPIWDDVDSQSVNIPLQPVRLEIPPPTARIDEIREGYKRILGKHGMFSRELSKRKSGTKS